MNFIKKWYIYQKERFPVITYGLYCFCIVFATFCFSNHCGVCNFNIVKNSGEIFINYYRLIPMFIVAFLQFLMVRIVDEFKDYEDDCKYRPYRPVPRGVVTLKELKILFIICVILQVIVTIIVNPVSLILLFLVWIFFAFMTKGFFIKKFLDEHILCEVFFDEFLLPITVLYLSSFVCGINFYSIWKVLVATYIVSWIIEIARKIRCKEDEEKGVKTYTAVFGINKVVLLLWILETFLLITIFNIINVKIYIIICYCIITIIDLLFVIKQNKIFSKCVEYLADIYVMGLLLSFVFLIL